MCWCVIQADLQLDDSASATAARIIAWADELSQPALRSNSRRSPAYLHIQRQEWQEAAALLDQAIDILSETDNRCEHLWFLRAKRAEAYLGLGRLDEAMEYISEYLALTRQSESRYFEGLALRIQAQIPAARTTTTRRSAPQTRRSLRLKRPIHAWSLGVRSNSARFCAADPIRPMRSSRIWSTPALCLRPAARRATWSARKPCHR